MTGVDPLTVRCSYCTMPAGETCTSLVTYDGRTVRPHKVRVRLAAEMAAHADPALDAWPQLGPTSDCGLCGSGLPQRHRIVDALACRMAAGESPEEVAADYEMPIAAVRTVQAWAARWPEGWR